MQFYTVFLVFGIAVVSAAGSDVQELPITVLENLHQQWQPLVEESNNLSTDGYLPYPGQFPYHAQLFINNDDHASTTISSGSLITPNYILTRADALRSNIAFGNMHGYAVLGVDRGNPEPEQRINFNESGTQLHPSYDIATVRLEHPVTFTTFVRPIRLARLSDSRTYEMMEGTNVGNSFDGTARYLRNQVMSNDDCSEQHPYAVAYWFYICTNAYVGGALCTRTHGSGLIVEDEKGPILVGITNVIYSCSLNYPILYIRVSEFRDWISMNSNYVFDA
ncbi:coagulation factor XII-like isoform X1 [Anopheles funestus]|uniref:coagulation factor XII-like isoform X1 n=1 Tax=Anopheles funestus TaxID=62324 RepID=UPI0020C6BCD0|nr:coagulation factor XII-like isoform X1 [Anopheles funestus]